MWQYSDPGLLIYLDEESRDCHLKLTVVLSTLYGVGVVVHQGGLEMGFFPGIPIVSSDHLRSSSMLHGSDEPFSSMHVIEAPDVIQIRLYNGTYTMGAA